ncbi:MAG: DUF5615 family PIN-like protein [Myxococcales bacterium]|nr:DUF5615 family PIN-like protein [Myxococcales bacterium]MCB9626066.1 DUF5615 family PIN-like protein [Sandaracinaceae bacterium]
MVSPKCFLLDENMPDAVRDVFLAEKQVVHLVRVVLGIGASDNDVAAYANDASACILTHNVKHFKALVGRRAEHRRASCLFMKCPEWEDADRIREIMPHILCEMERPGPDRRMFMTVGSTDLTIER